MEYENNLSFAVRNILIYKEHKDLFKDFEYTFLCGTLLNVLSAIKPDEVFIIKFNSVSGMEFPHLQNITEGDSIENYLRIFRNGLAHKTNENFVVESTDGRIDMITIKENKYTFTDLESVLYLIDKAIQDDSTKLYEDEKKVFDALLKQ